MQAVRSLFDGLTFDQATNTADWDALTCDEQMRLEDLINSTEGYIVGGVTEPTTMHEDKYHPDFKTRYERTSRPTNHYAKFKELWNQYELQLNDYIQDASDQSAELMWGYAIDENLTEDVCFPSGLGVGTWIHEGQIYFDLVQRIYNLDVAARIAKERGEIAIYDCKNQKEILL